MGVHSNKDRREEKKEERRGGKRRAGRKERGEATGSFSSDTLPGPRGFFFSGMNS